MNRTPRKFYILKTKNINRTPRNFYIPKKKIVRRKKTSEKKTTPKNKNH